MILVFSSPLTNPLFLEWTWHKTAIIRVCITIIIIINIIITT